MQRTKSLSAASSLSLPTTSHASLEKRQSVPIRVFSNPGSGCWSVHTWLTFQVSTLARFKIQTSDSLNLLGQLGPHHSQLWCWLHSLPRPFPISSGPFLYSFFPPSPGGGPVVS